jgi:ATP-binding cassette subfamily C protein
MTDAAERLPTASGPEVRRVVRELLRPRRRAAALAAAVLVAASAAGLCAPLLLGVIVERVTDGRDGDAMTLPAVGLLVVVVAQSALSAIGVALVAAVGQPMLAELRERVVDRGLRIPAERLERAGRGDLLSRVGDDVAAISEAVVEALPGLAAAAVSIGLTFAGLAAIDLRLGLAGLCAVPVQALALRWYLPRARPVYADERVAGGARAQTLLEAVGGARTIRALGLADAELPRVADRSNASVTAAVRAVRVSTGFFSRLNAAELVGTAAVLVAGFLLVRADALTIGGATAGALLFVRLFDQFNVVLGTIDDAQRALAALARLVGVATIDPPRDPAAPPMPAPDGDGAAAVVARGVRHAYAGGPDVLHGVDLELAAGERVALVGVSGAGKTTLAKVLAGFHSPAAGEVTIGGVRLPELGPSATRRAVGLVTQEVHVFAGPLATDLRLAAPDAEDERIEAALALVGALDWARALPDGIATVVGTGGVALTATQAQQVALARLALADPPVAVLDEATAEAGSAGARVLEAAADRVLAGRTALVVAHRLTQAQRADRVVVMEAGRIVEEGPHERLVAAGGAYAALWRAWSADRHPRRSEAGLR